MDYSQRVQPGKKVDLGSIDPSWHDGMEREAAEQLTVKLGAEMSELQDLLYDAGDTGLLIVLQGRDTSGKDGTIQHILDYTNAQSCRVASFKIPTPLEARHDFLWRVHAQTPALGDMVIFNRSHYEDVLVVRVHSLVPKKMWQKRYDHINNFEQLLTEQGVTILKFYLHISKDEQHERLMARETDVTRAWKLSAGDWKERAYWDKYATAYEDALSKCSTSAAPWHIISANHKWFRNLAVTEAIVKTLRPMKKEWMARLTSIGTVAKKELAEYRATPGAQK